MKKALLILLSFILFFQLKVLAGVDGIPDGTYIGKANIFVQANDLNLNKKIRNKINSLFALVIANGHITGLLLTKFDPAPHPDAITVEQSISINKTVAFTKLKNGISKFDYDQTNKTIKFNAVNNTKSPEASLTEAPIAKIYKIIGQAKIVKGEKVLSIKDYSENINNDCKSTHFINIGIDGFVTVQLPLNSSNPTFFGRINNYGDFTTIYSEYSLFRENRILSIISNEEKIIAKGLSIEFDPSANTIKDTPFEIEFLKTECN